MMFTTKTEYGMRAMVVLAKNKSRKPLSLAEISKLEHISQPYLERLFRKLKSDGLVKSIKGVNGGYVLARKPKDITMFEIVQCLEGVLAVFYCIGDNQSKISCPTSGCLTKKVWDELQKNIITTLRRFTLADLI